MADWKNKDMSGTFANGQGPVLGQSIKIESETKGVLGGGGAGYDLKEVAGSSHETQGSEDKAFDLHSKSYAGPGNWQPEDKGVRNPNDIGM